MIGFIAAAMIFDVIHTTAVGPMLTLDTLVLSFAFYGFLGWLWESTVCMFANRGTFANSGFLLGPCCPIYGVGAIVCWYGLRGIESPFAQFLAAGVVCCAIEYLVGVLLEATTHTRFWDYSNFPLNIHGRVCLYGFLLFGSACVLICRTVEPALLAVLAAAPAWLVVLLALGIVVAIAIDAAFSMASFRRLNDTLEALRGEVADRINDGMKDASDSLVERIPESAFDSAQEAKVRGRAVNGWLKEISDATLDVVRDRVEMPAFVVDTAAGLLTIARRASGKVLEAVPRPRLPKISLTRRDLRFFNAFPHLRMLPYEGIIRMTKLKDQALSLFPRKRP